MPKRAADHLSRREREIMNALFALTAVRVMLARLEKKGYLRHEQENARNVYSATTSPVAAKRAALRQYLQTFFGGSLRDMMTALVRDESWADDDLDTLRGEIDRVRKQRRQS
jgi:predicted transcriptional regulator